MSLFERWAFPPEVEVFLGLPNSEGDVALT